MRCNIGGLASLVWSQVRHELVVREADTKTGTPALIADLAICGVWLSQAEALFDVRVIDTDTQSCSDHSPKEVLRVAEGEKKKKYMAACEAHCVLFTLICCSVDGMFGSEAEVFLKRASESLSSKWGKSYSEIMGWVRTRMSFAILRTSIL